MDEENNPICALSRSTAHRDKIWHRTTDIWVTDASHAKILCHKRSAKKDTHPNLFDSTFGGHLLAGENPEQSAARELEEEMRIRVDHSCLQYVEIVRLVDQHEYEYRYSYQCKVAIDLLQYEKEEIDEIFWVEIDHLVKIYQEKTDSSWVYRVKELEMLGSISSSRT